MHKENKFSHFQEEVIFSNVDFEIHSSCTYALFYRISCMLWLVKVNFRKHGTESLLHFETFNPPSTRWPND